MSRAISWIAYGWLLTVETLEEVFDRLLAEDRLQQRFDFKK